jgi:hypothetical protein
MRVVGRHRFVVGVLLIAALATIGWRYASQRQAQDPRQSVSATSLSTENVQRTSAPPGSAGPTVQYNTSTVFADTGVLRGRVVDAATKAPVREFKIEFFGNYAAKPTPGARVFQTKDGRFSWPDVPVDVWQITASATGYQRFEVGEVSIRKGIATQELVLPLRRGFTVTGRVFDEVTRDGIENATVSFRDAQLGEYDGTWRRRERTTTDRNGSFVLDGVPAGRILISADSEEHASKAVTISVGPEPAPVQIGLSTGGLISGQLTSADGVTGVAGWIWLSNLDRNTRGGSKSGPNGEFTYKNLTPGRYRLVGQSEFGQAEITIALAPDERRENVVLALAAGSVIRGTITGLSDADLRRTSISTHVGSDHFTYGESSIDARGNFAVSGIKPGQVRVIVDVTNRLQVSRVVEVPSAGEVTVDFDFSRGARLSGRVTRSGKPWSHVYVSADPELDQGLHVYPVSASTQGVYAFDNLPYGEYRLTVARHRTPVVRVDGDKEFDVDVPAVANLQGQVSENPSGAPIVGAQVDLWPSGGLTKLMPYTTATDHFGRFTLMSVQPGDYVVTIYKTDFEMYRERVTFGNVTESREIRLQSDRGIRVRARTATGAAISTLRVSELVGNRRARSMRLLVDDEGSAYLPRRLNGSSLSFTVAGFETIEVRAWDGRELDLRFAPQQPQ